MRALTDAQARSEVMAEHLDSQVEEAQVRCVESDGCMCERVRSIGVVEHSNPKTHRCGTAACTSPACTSHLSPRLPKKLVWCKPGRRARGQPGRRRSGSFASLKHRFEGTVFVCAGHSGAREGGQGGGAARSEAAEAASRGGPAPGRRRQI